MDMTGYTERGFKRKLAVQILFGKVYYLSEVIRLIKLCILECLFQIFFFFFKVEFLATQFFLLFCPFK